VSEPATPPVPADRPRRRGRAIVGWVVLVLAALLLLVTTLAVWVDRVALNTEVFTDTSTQLIEDEAIREAVATRAVDELFTSVDVEAELKGQLPADYQNLSGPATAGLREGAYTVVARALERPRLQRLWTLTLEESHRTLVQVLEGEGERVSTEEGVVTLDLGRLVLESAERIGIRDQIEDQLPEDVGRIEILRSEELDTAQNVFSILNALAWLLPILTIVAFAIVVWLAGDRRRAVRRIGIALAIVGVLGLVVVNLAGGYLVNELVAETDTQTAANNAWDILTELLRDSHRSLVVVGLLFLIASWLAGPSARAVGARRYVAPLLRERVWAYAGLALVALVLLVVGDVADFTRFLMVAVVVALLAIWIEVMRALTIREYPDASGAASFAEARARLGAWWEEARERATQPRATTATASPAAAADLTSTLATLADLHARGELTEEEYAAAKARVLAGG
jgi:Short C-terminal domain